VPPPLELPARGGIWERWRLPLQGKDRLNPVLPARGGIWENGGCSYRSKDRLNPVLPASVKFGKVETNIHIIPDGKGDSSGSL